MSNPLFKKNMHFPQNMRKIVLVGNPNAGKSVLFNALTGVYADVSNYPGTTLQINHSCVNNDCIIDTPGIYGISSYNEEETTARDIILGADIVINVVNAVHLERDLFLTQQIIDMGKPVVIALNMMDEASKLGVKIDTTRLAHLLGVPVVPTIATRRQGFDELKQAVAYARPGRRLSELKSLFLSLMKRDIDPSEALLILEGDPYVANRNGLRPMNKQEEIYQFRRKRVDFIISQIIEETGTRPPLKTRLSSWMLEPLTGIPFLIFTLFLLYQFIGVFIAQTVVGITEAVVMQEYFEPFIRRIIYFYLPDDSIPAILLAGEFGVLTMTATYLLGLLLPLVTGFYLCLSILEDSGYLPRIAVLSDRSLMKIGLNGRGIIPLILGFGCVTAAIITTRLLSNSREKRIATYLLALSIPCSAQLAVITAIIVPMGLRYVSIYIVLILSVFFLAGKILNRFLPGKPGDLFMDLPPLRWPQPVNLFKKTAFKTSAFVKEAAPLFAAGALLIGVMEVSGFLEVLQHLLIPLTVHWLQLPEESANAFILGFIRRDFGAFAFLNLPMSPGQQLVALLTITIFVPCSASVLVILKERGFKEGITIWLSILFIAFLIGGVVSQIIV